MREHREKRQWTRAQLAAKSNVSASHLRVIETRQGNPSLVVFVAIARALGVDADKLLVEVLQREAYLKHRNRAE